MSVLNAPGLHNLKLKNMNFIILNLNNEVQNTIKHVKENNKITKSKKQKQQGKGSKVRAGEHVGGVGREQTVMVAARPAPPLGWRFQRWLWVSCRRTCRLSLLGW